ncbi:MAG: phosphatase PAP2 family protein [Acidobacteriota bacterium]|nr:phosphatase PAP2 family protein [Acidobacteriota bacterium]
MAKNLHPDDYPGWHLLVGFLFFVGMTVMLAAIAEDVVTGDPLTVVDAQLSGWLHAHSTPLLTTLFARVTLLGSTLLAGMIAGLVALYMLRRRQLYWFCAFVLSVYGGMILNRLLKYAFQRARPRFDDPVFSFTGYSFPSGHTMTATVVYGAIAVVVFTRNKNRAFRMVVIACAALLIGLVGFSRIYLGAHYLSDVLGAIAEGLAWLSLCFTGVYFLWRRHHRRSRNSKT